MSVKVLIVDNNFISSEMADISFFGGGERSRIESISNVKRKRESTAGLVALKSLFDDDVKREIVRDEDGRPSFVCGMGEDFNISHSGALTAVAYQKGEEIRVGIDIEQIKEGRDEKLFRIAERYFSEKEKELLKKESSSREFYRIWTAKEAEAKMTGFGLSKMLSDGYRTEQENRPKGHFLSYLVIYREEIYIMTLCTNKKDNVQFMCDEGLEALPF